MFWCVLDGVLFNTEKDVLIGGVYMPPEGTPYASRYSFSDIENEILNINSAEEYHILLLGDFNAHTGSSCDFIEDMYDTTLPHLWNTETALNVERIPNLSDLGIQTERT